MRAAAAALALAALLAARAALASPVLELAGDVQGTGGLCARALESGAADAYFNPAFLPDAAPGLDVGVFVLHTDIGVQTWARPGGADVPLGAVDQERPGGGRYDRRPVPTDWLERGRMASAAETAVAARPRQAAGSGRQTHAYQAVGLVGQLLGPRLVAGLHVLVPYDGISGARAFYADEREQYFSNSLHAELAGDRFSSLALSFALGSRVLPRLALGLGFTLGLHTGAVTPTYLDDVGRFQEILVDSDVNVRPSLAPHLGAVFTPRPGTRLSLTAHAPQQQTIETRFSFLLADGLQQTATVEFTHGYLPWTFAAGGSHEVGAFTLAAVVEYALWSQYRDRHGERPAAPFAWRDTLAGSAGVRYRRGLGRAFLDLAYQPSPVPDQIGRTSYVDNARLGASAGAQLVLPAPGGSLRLGFQVQGHRLLARETRKDPTSPDPVVDEVPDDAVVGGQPLPGRAGLQTNNPGWPGFTSQGWILGAGVNVAWLR